MDGIAIGIIALPLGVLAISLIGMAFSSPQPTSAGRTRKTSSSSGSSSGSDSGYYGGVSDYGSHDSGSCYSDSSSCDSGGGDGGGGGGD